MQGPLLTARDLMCTGIIWNIPLHCVHVWSLEENLLHSTEGTRFEGSVFAWQIKVRYQWVLVSLPTYADHSF